MNIFRPAAVLSMAMLLSTAAQAAEFREFDTAAFASAQAAGEPVLVDVRAWWCPVCASQRHTIKKIVAAPAYDKLVVFELNYDRQKSELKRFGVSRQGTLIAFKGATETGRIIFQTDPGKIQTLLKSAVQ